MNARPLRALPPDYSDLDDIDPMPPASSDDALALRFCDRHDSDLRFVVASGKMVSLGWGALAAR
jgi:hypothetical protein